MSNMDLFYSIMAGVLPSLIWLFFWNKEDSSQPEPRTLLAGCFFGGMLAVLVAIEAEKFIMLYVTDVFTKYTIWSFIEEMTKFVAVGLIALTAKSNDEPIDAIIYCIAVALGFAALENALFIISEIKDGSYLSGFIMGNMRFIGATLLHVVSSSLIGFGLAFTYYMKPKAKFIGWTIGIVAAVSLHAAFNLSIIKDGANALKTFGWIWVAVVIMIILFEEAKAVKPDMLRKKSKPETTVSVPASVTVGK